jgi:hypothetical protein
MKLLRMFCFFLLFSSCFPSIREVHESRLNSTGLSYNNSVVDIVSRPRIKQRFILKEPTTPVAFLILFAGGHGILNINNYGEYEWGGGNFLVRSSGHFVRNGFSVVIVDAPSDRKSRGMLYGFRASKSHAEDIASVILFLKMKADIPVWLVGTSRGTNSAANGAIRIGRNGVSGLVLTSSMTRTNKNGVQVFEMPLNDISIPTLVIHHKYDGCRFTPYRDTSRIIKKLHNTSIAELISFEGGIQPISQPCDALSQHGYYGIESKVVNTISSWIKREIAKARLK